MVNLRAISASLAVSLLAGTAVAHPGESKAAVKREAYLLNRAQAGARRAITGCADAENSAALKARSAARRAATAEALRKKRGLDSHRMRGKRDQAALEKYLAVDHNVTHLGYTLDTPIDVIFDSNSSVALIPEVTIGPYWVSGELIRTDITDDEPGVPLHLDLQFIDLNTCQAVPKMLIDAWHCNATGVYSGVATTGQGGLNSTFGRGIQETDEDGVVQFDTIFPGHYTGRTGHIHIMSTENATILPNNTYLTNGKANHIGQIFFDQHLINAVESLSPYTSNEQTLTLNSEDGIGAQTATDAYDPFVDYVLLGPNLQDGLLAYITVFVDTTANVTANVQAAAHYYQGGGVANPDAGGGFPGGPGGPGGPPPSGSFPPLPSSTAN
ncbi:Intradiol ring-cleavage dioxygenase [Durotheca rogersii]|uniref:Intradiol ring-cleavage dioxygenase n=1 Tax=Durotheca rogersii TaxID=419775 RepID=UPI00221E8CC7|nr:Intradiol ring-cleavage dioxygenase [Durotheca rogersii]KAI5864908.1 Intradiol ring-cleavage dioxygenase [Durotheca rogersii]